jgi:hypothetical protein
MLREDVSCVVAEPELLLGAADGVRLAAELARRGASLIPLSSDRWGEVATAGQMAWDLVPQLRLSLNARNQQAGAPELG